MRYNSRIFNGLTPFAGVLVLSFSAIVGAQTNDEERSRAAIDRVMDHVKTQIAAFNRNSDLSGDEKSLRIATLSEGYDHTALGGGVFGATFDEFVLGIGPGTIDFSPVHIRTQPRADQTTLVTVELPERVRLRSDQEDENLDIIIENQDFRSVWNENDQLFTTLHIQTGAIRIDADTPMISSQTLAQALTGNYRVIVEHDKSWSNEAAFKFDGFAIDAQLFKFAARQLLFHMDNRGSDFDEFLSANQNFTASVADQSIPTDISRQITQTFSEMFSLAADSEISLAAKQVELEQFGEKMLSAGKLLIGAVGSNRERSLRGGMKIAADDIVLSETLPLPLAQGLVPHSFRFEFETGPFSERFLNAMAAGISERIEGASAVETSAEPSPELLSAFMTNEPIGLSIRDTYIRARDAAVELSANAQTNPQSAMGGDGHLKLEVRGLPTLLEETGADQMPEIAQALSLFATFSDRTEENGEVYDRLNVSLNPQGQLLVNGEDVSPMLGMGLENQ